MKELCREDFKPGQIVYLLKIQKSYGDFIPRHIDDLIYSAIVHSVSWKYIVIQSPDVKFEIADDFREYCNGSPKWKLYLTREDAEEAVQTFERRKTVKDLANQYIDQLPVEGLREIEAIINRYRKDGN